MIFITNAVILTPFCRLNDKIAVIDNGIITEICSRADIPDGAEVIDAKGLYLAPGFVDIHVHGGGGYGTMSLKPDEIVKMCEAHASYGTTSILPTTLASPISTLKKAALAVKEAKKICDASKSSNILGVHLEGPFLAKSQRGAQNEENILVPEEEDYINLLDTWDGIRIMGAAPETAGAMKLGRELRRRGILASIAHSDANYDTCVEAVSNGFSDVTHIYSGCSSVIRINGYRVAGVVEAGLGRDELTVQVIADLKHLPIALLKLIYKCKGADRISLITDGLEYAAAELEEGTVYTQDNGVQTVYEDGVMKLMDRQAFAGSVATSNRLVRNMYHSADVPLLDAVKMATATPARIIGAAEQKGCIAEGADADLILFDDNIDIKMVMVMGEIKKCNL